MMMYYTYILISTKDGSKYIGATSDLARRISEHNAGNVQYTKSKRPWKLVWYCAFIEKAKAYKFEKYLKSGSGHAFINKRFL